LENSERLVAVRQAVDSLPKRRKAVLLLHISGFKLEEIAEHLGWSVNTVRHLLYRGIESVRKNVRRREKTGVGAAGGGGGARAKIGDRNQQP
jgi:DNA-directed RNA polymerase specialized sigma24 family protein